ncbi:MAG: DNA-processing protein DprA [Acidobacteriota bacterium]
MMPAASAPILISSDEQLHWLALRMTPGLGSRTAIRLLEHFGNPQGIFRASPQELQAAGASAGLSRSLSSGCAFEDAVTQQRKLAQIGATLVPYSDQSYPAQLKSIYDPPPLLFAWGHVELLQSLTLAIVGDSAPDLLRNRGYYPLGKGSCGGRAHNASGMARGIDTAAHKAVLEVGGNTIAVFGCGVDELYPAENRKLSAEIAESGLILSDFPMGTPPYPQNFPIRNRIISGISLGVLIVEGGQYSGSSITARLAMEQGREVFAVPGNITSKTSYGPIY